MNSGVYAGRGATLPELSSDEEDSESCESVGGPEKSNLPSWGGACEERARAIVGVGGVL